MGNRTSSDASTPNVMQVIGAPGPSKTTSPTKNTTTPRTLGELAERVLGEDYRSVLDDHDLDYSTPVDPGKPYLEFMVGDKMVRCDVRDGKPLTHCNSPNCHCLKCEPPTPKAQHQSKPEQLPAAVPQTVAPADFCSTFIVAAFIDREDTPEAKHNPDPEVCYRLTPNRSPSNDIWEPATKCSTHISKAEALGMNLTSLAKIVERYSGGAGDSSSSSSSLGVEMSSSVSESSTEGGPATKDDRKLKDYRSEYGSDDDEDDELDIDVDLRRNVGHLFEISSDKRQHARLWHSSDEDEDEDDEMSGGLSDEDEGLTDRLEKHMKRVRARSSLNAQEKRILDMRTPDDDDLFRRPVNTSQRFRS